MRKFLFFGTLFLTFSVLASHDQCPNLQGTFYCKAVQGSHKDMTMKISQKVGPDESLIYTYTYLQNGEEPLELSFLASDQGTPNPEEDGDLGKCLDRNFFLTSSGEVEEKSLFNTVNEKGEYLVLRARDLSVFLSCPRLEN